jgi:hypothetical protein
MANSETKHPQPTAEQHGGTQGAGQGPVTVQMRDPDHLRDAGAQKAEIDKRNRDELERSREARANRPQDMAFGGKPTPTQAENDEFRMGLRHVDDKEPSGSPPDYGEAYDEFRAKFHQEHLERSKAGGQKAR